MTTTTKKRYKVEAFEWVFGERITRKLAYVSAYSERQALLLAFRGQPVRDGWSFDVREVEA